MNKNYTHITFILDRSGSMHSAWNDVVGGYAAMISDNKKLDEKCTFSLIAFDDAQEIIEDMTDIKNVSETLTVRPRGNTALNDAIGSNIVVLGEKLSKLPEHERPGKVLFMIQTDGLENASKEYTWNKVNELIKEHKDKYNWQFLFLGASEESLNQAKRMGIAESMVSTYSTGIKMSSGFSKKMLDARNMTYDSYYSGALCFSESEKKELNS